MDLYGEWYNKAITHETELSFIGWLKEEVIKLRDELAEIKDEAKQRGIERDLNF